MTPNDLYLYRSIEYRTNAAPVITDTVFRAVEVWPEYGVAVGQPLRVFCYVQGYPSLGRRLPPWNGKVGYGIDECRPIFTL